MGSKYRFFQARTESEALTPSCRIDLARDETLEPGDILQIGVKGGRLFQATVATDDYDAVVLYSSALPDLLGLKKTSASSYTLFSRNRTKKSKLKRPSNIGSDPIGEEQGQPASL